MKELLSSWQKGMRVHKALAWHYGKRESCQTFRIPPKVPKIRTRSDIYTPLFISEEGEAIDEVPKEEWVNPLDALDPECRGMVDRCIALAEEGVPEIRDPEYDVFPEHTLKEMRRGHLVSNRFVDLMVVSKDRSRIIIVDWKTNTTPSGNWAQLYRYLQYAMQEWGLAKDISGALVHPNMETKWKRWRGDYPFMHRGYDPERILSLGYREDCRRKDWKWVNKFGHEHPLMVEFQADRSGD